MLKKLTIRKKVYCLAIFGGSLSALIAFSAIYSLNAIGKQLKQIAEEDILLTNKVTEITIHQLEQAVSFERAVRYAQFISKDKDALDNYKKAKARFKSLAKKVDEEIFKAERFTEEILEYESGLANSKIVTEFEKVLKILKEVEVAHVDFNSHVFETYLLFEDGKFLEGYNLAKLVSEEEDHLDEVLENLLLELEDFTAKSAIEAERLEHEFLNVIIIVSLLSISIFILFSKKIVVGIVKPLLATKDYADLLSNGSLDASQPFHDSEDEISDMMKSLSVFKENAKEADILRKEQEELRENTKLNEIETKRQQKAMMLNLADSFDKQVCSTIDSLIAAASELQSTAESMKSIADKTKVSSQEVAASSEQSTSNVTSVTSAIGEVSQSSLDITQQICEVKIKSTESSSDASQANFKVNNLNTLVENIGEIVDAIKDIAEQTNVLALNANIEAARAGESGKGFAVVANEVKKLATETGEKINLIESKISEIQNATKESVEAMQRIITNISGIDESVDLVSNSIQEQSSNTNKITESTSEALAGVKHVSKIMNTVQEGAKQTGTSADVVLTSAKEVTKLSDTLKESVGIFLIEVRGEV